MLGESRKHYECLGERERGGVVCVGREGVDVCVCCVLISVVMHNVIDIIAVAISRQIILEVPHRACLHFMV